MKRRSVLKFPMHKNCSRSLLKMQNESSIPRKPEFISLQGRSWNPHFKQAPFPHPQVTWTQVGHDHTLTTLQLSLSHVFANCIPGATLGVQGWKMKEAAPLPNELSVVVAMACVCLCLYELTPFLQPIRGRSYHLRHTAGSRAVVLSELSLPWSTRSKTTWPLLTFPHVSCHSLHATGLHTSGALNVEYFPQTLPLLSSSHFRCCHPCTTFSDNPV